MVGQMKHWVIANKQTLVRVGSILTMLVTVVVLTRSFILWDLNTDKFTNLDYAAGIAFMGAFFGWIKMEFTCSLREHPHDIFMVRKIREIFHTNFVSDLENVDLGAVFQAQFLKGFVPLVRNMDSVEFEFFDKELQIKLEKLVNLSSDFYFGVASIGGPVGTGLYAILSDDELSKDWFELDTRKKVDKYNDLANEVLWAYKDFIRFSRKILPSAYQNSEIIGGPHSQVIL